jgi:DNA-binding beta-propeller fold protein YncE
MILLLAAFALPLGGCLVDAAPPFLGPCAVYPEGQYDYGEIGIGTCLAGPTDLRFLDHGGRAVLAVSNSNAFRDFSGGSVLFIDWESVDLDASRNLLSDLRAHAVDLPHYPGTLASLPERGLLAVPVRNSEEARTRVNPDDLYFIDVSDPMVASLAPVASGGLDHLTVGSDPYATAVDPDAGLLYVGNRTDHTISLVDAAADPIEVVAMESQAYVGSDRWFDADGSGSKAAFSLLERIDADLVTDDTWRLGWIEGTRIVWTPVQSGLRRHVSGGGPWRQVLGTEADPADADPALAALEDPDYFISTEGPRLVFSDGASIQGAWAEDQGLNWDFAEAPLLSGRATSWDAVLGGPRAVDFEGVTWLFYDGREAAEPTSGASIGLARAATGSKDFARVGSGPILVPGGKHDALGQSDPFVLYDKQASAWRMYYTAWDGERRTLGHAWSDDLETWVADAEPVYAIDETDLVGPVAGNFNGRFVLGCTRLGPEGASYHFAESAEGLHWSPSERVSAIPVEGAVDPDVARPATLAMAFFDYGAFSVTGDLAGPQQTHATGGVTLESSLYGWRLRTAVGQLADLPESGAGERGLSVSSVLPEQGLAWLDLQDRDGRRAIGVAEWDGLDLLPDDLSVLEAGAAGGFDADGVYSPVVIEGDDGLVMFYAGMRGGIAQVGRATSLDGIAWTRDTAPVLKVGQDWDSISVVPGSVELRDDGSLRLWYAGSDGSRVRIGAAVSQDGGLSFHRVESDDGWLLDTGAPGDWDDTSVKAPFVLAEGGALHLWYAGFDGSVWRVGYASSADDGASWSRGDADEDFSLPVLEGRQGWFDYAGVDRPVLVPDADGYLLFYRGYDGNLARPGLARGDRVDLFYKTPRLPTWGDQLTFATREGNALEQALPLDQKVKTFDMMFVGMSAMHLDAERGFLYVASKLLSYLAVIDVRDDSESGFDDANYLDIETVLAQDGSSQTLGFRAMGLVPGSPYLYALNDSPEAVYIFDTSLIEDDADSEVLWNSVVGWLPTPRGAGRDEGEDTVSKGGPISFAVLPDGHTLLVANFNANSLTAYDLRMGAWGQLVGECPLLGENPSGVVVSPDGRYAVVSVYQGHVEDDTVNSTLAVIDVDPSSPAWMQVVTWIVNQ